MCIVRAAVIAAFVLFAPAGTQAQVPKSGYGLPLSLALEAALEAVNTCAGNGYYVTAVVVDMSGTPQVVLRGDHSTIHTRDSACGESARICFNGRERAEYLIPLAFKHSCLVLEPLVHAPSANP